MMVNSSNSYNYEKSYIFTEVIKGVQKLIHFFIFFV